MTVLVEDRTYEKLKRRAKVAGGTVSEEVRAILSEKLDEPPNNDWFLKLAEIGKEFPAKVGQLDHDRLDEVVAKGIVEDYHEAAASFAAELEARRRSKS